jgi:hypothetical protein
MATICFSDEDDYGDNYQYDYDHGTVLIWTTMISIQAIVTATPVVVSTTASDSLEAYPSQLNVT